MLARCLVLLLLACTAVGAVDAPALTSVTLTGTDGRSAPLARYRGKPAIVFYEDRGSTSLNQAVKDALIARARRDDLLDAAAVVAVANIAAYDFFPARGIATAFIRRAEAAAGIPILLDVDGTLTGSPWLLPGDTSTILLLDRTGHVVWKHSGPLPPEQAAAMLDRLAALARDG